MFKRGRSGDPAIRELLELTDECKERGLDDVVKRLELIAKLSEDRNRYCEKSTSQESQALNSLKDETMAYPFEKAYEDGKTVWNLMPGMMSGHLEGKFLQCLASMSKVKHVLEIGMFTGYAALAMAEVIPEDGTVTTCELDPFLENLARKFFSKSPHGKKITIKIGPAKTTLEKLVEEKAQFDFVFIDADKTGYLDYFKIIMDQGLLSPNGTIVFDNAMMGGHAYLPDTPQERGLAMRKVNEYLATREDLLKVLVPIKDGVLVVRRKSDSSW